MTPDEPSMIAMKTLAVIMGIFGLPLFSCAVGYYLGSIGVGK